MPLALAACREVSATAALTAIGSRQVGQFRIEGGAHGGAIGPAEADVVERLVRTATDCGVPIVGVVSTSGADVTHGVASLAGWGRVARAMTLASGCVPTCIIVTGPALAGPSLLLGLVDVVVLTADAFAYVSGPDAVAEVTGVATSRTALGGADVHAVRSGLASFVTSDEAAAMAVVEQVLSFLPHNNHEPAPVYTTTDPVDRDTAVAAAVVPHSSSAGYDVRRVIADVVDDGFLLEARARWATNIVTGFATVAGRPVGIVANQPGQLAGTIDVEGSIKAARFVQLCDSFNLPLVTFVDTPGFQPGKDLEWRGMIRYGAQLVHAYAAATVPRVCVVLRKAYGGAYIVMDSRGLHSDYVAAWAGAEIAVMGASGAVQVLHGRRDIGDAERDRLVAEYKDTYCTPEIAARRGFVDDVIERVDTRRVVAEAICALAGKREHLPRRRHSNSPL